MRVCWSIVNCDFKGWDSNSNETTFNSRGGWGRGSDAAPPVDASNAAIFESSSKFVRRRFWVRFMNSMVEGLAVLAVVCEGESRSNEERNL
jgi:hypothetical protein